jgi:putative transposase
MTRELIEVAVTSGARRQQACDMVGLSVRTVERWRGGKEEDARHGPTQVPANALSARERTEIVAVITSPPFRDLSPHQIVPALADACRYLASESTIYRILRAETLLTHRGRAKAPVRRPPRAHVATGPDQVWSWDITYLKSPIRGLFFYLYLILDVWSRKIVGWALYEREGADLAAALFERVCTVTGIDPRGIVLHADNGGPMKGATMVATLERLGVHASFSRPSVSDDNPFSESLFRTMKYRPEYPERPFAGLAAAEQWVTAFVAWYNTRHLHSAIRFVTPEDRHSGRDVALLAGRRAVYARARLRHPERWSGTSRNWDQIREVFLNPDTADAALDDRAAA